MDYFVHPEGICETESVGAGTKVWAFAHVLPGATIGKDCNICDHVFIENDVVVGDRVTIKCGVQLWDGLRVGNDVFIGPNATFTNDPFPKSKQRPAEFVKTTLEPGCSVGANATILPGISIGRNAMVGAGAVVTRSVPANAIVYGNPARIQGYVSQTAGTTQLDTPIRHEDVPIAFSHVQGVIIHQLPAFEDIRGRLVAAEMAQVLPFTPARFFLVHAVPSAEVRGEHAHRCCEQFLVCVKGSVHVVVDDGSTRQEIVLDRPEIGIHVKPLVWGTQYKYSEDAVLLVFASQPYDPNDYIRDYGIWLKTLKETKPSGKA
jgi:acetyltransferase-like isoleucine patch superfamily enzyme/dTDP-4-dehydrorhamnose 3,5-epimerase-like enzyme